MTPRAERRNLEAIEKNYFIEEKLAVGKEVAIGKVTAHLCLTLNIKELKINVQQKRVVTTLRVNGPWERVFLRPNRLVTI
jgi:hypothetical protein